MANLDSLSKRASLIQSLLPASTVLPAPDGTIDVYDRAHLAHLYSGQAPVAYTMHVSDRPGTEHVQEFSVGDVILVQALDGDGNLSESWVQIVDITDQTTYWDYVVNLMSGDDVVYPEGTTLLDLGASGEGIVRNVSSGDDTPYIEAFTHDGAPWSTVTAHAVIGNLEAYTGETEWGIATGADLTSLTGDYVVLSGSRVLFNADVNLASGKAIHHPDSSTAGWVLADVSGDGNFYPAAPTGGGISLSASRGALIYGDSTPAWGVMAHPGNAYRHLETDGTDFAWQANVTLASGAWIGIGGEAGRIAFDDQAVDQVEIRDAVLLVNAATMDTNYAATAKVSVEDGAIGSSVEYSEAVTGAAFNAFTYGSNANAYSRWVGRRARGSRGSESAVQSGDILGRIGAAGYGTSFPAASSGYMQIEATQTWGSAAYGTELNFCVTPDDDTTAIIALTLLNSGIGYFPYGIRTKISTANVSSPPTDAELDAAFGTPATVGASFIGAINDNDADEEWYLVLSSGSKWVYFRGYLAD